MYGKLCVTMLLATPLTLGIFQATHAQTPPASHTLVIAVPYLPPSYDPDTFVPGGLQQAGNTYDALFGMATKPGPGGRPVDDVSTALPMLVDTLTISPDGTDYRMKLRKGVKSSFGNEMTSADVDWGWQRGKAMGSNNVFNARMAGVESFAVLSPDEVEFKLSAPTRILTLMLLVNVFDSTEVKKHTTADDPWAKDWLSRNTAGFGPYQLLTSRPGEGATFVFNANYWGPRPYYDRVVYREVASPASRATLIRSKQVQWADEMPLQQVTALEKDPNVKVETTPLFGSASLRMNPKFKPFNDVRVREAVFYALDYDAIQRVVFNGMATRARSAVSLEIPGGVDVNPEKMDLPRAKKLLADAGYADGLDVELTYSSNWWWEEPLAVQAKDSLAKAGIRVTLKSITTTEMAGRRAGRVADIPFFTHMSSPSVATPAYALALNALSGASMNPIAYSNPKVDQLIKAAGAERDEAKYMALVKDMQETYAADYVHLDTFHPPTFGVMAPCIQNWIWKPLNTFEWKYLVCK